MYKPRHFQLWELVCPHVFNKYGEQAWTFLDPRLLLVDDFLADQLGSIIINNWHEGGEFSQRGLRCVLCQLVKDAIKAGTIYESAHLRGQANDLNVVGKTYDKVNLWIMTNPLNIPYPIRIERNTKGWTHIDVCNDGKNGYTVQTFLA
jgi:hypothetical protein